MIPNNIFFNPKKKFINWAKTFVGDRLVFDCGAGVGRLSKKLADQKVRVVALDILEREDPEFDDILFMRADQFPFPNKSVIIIARPNRGWWIHETMLRALQRECTVIYVGLKKHLKDDLHSLGRQFDLVMENAGSESEEVYIVQ